MKNRYSNLIKELKRAKKTARFSVVRDGERVMITTDVFAVRIEESEYNDYIKPAFPDIDIEKGCYLVVYPVVTSKEYGYINAFDLTDILTVIKDMDISRYIKMDTLARDYCIEICEKLISENY